MLSHLSKSAVILEQVEQIIQKVIRNPREKHKIYPKEKVRIGRSLSSRLMSLTN